MFFNTVIVAEGIQDSAHGIVTCYGLDGLGFESQRGQDFPDLSTPAVRPTQPPVEWVLGLVPHGTVAGAWYRYAPLNDVSVNDEPHI
jgi:hypothetical protein